MASPEGHDDDPDQGEVKIIVKEMWCSPYAADPHYTTDISKPVIDEIKQRKKLQSCTHPARTTDGSIYF